MSSYPPPGGPPPGPAGPPGPPSAPQPGPPPPAASSPAPRRTGVLVTGLGVVLLVVIAVVGALVVRGTPSVSSLEPGDCLAGHDLAAADADVAEFDVVDCGRPHDAEVLAVVELTAEAADGYTGEAGAAACAEQVSTTGELAGQGVEVRPMTKDGDLAAGDHIACLARRADGAAVTGRIPH